METISTCRLPPSSRSVSPCGHLAEQIAIPADEIDQAGRAARLGGDPLEVPLIQADPVVVDQALTGGDGQGGRRSAGQGRRDVGEDALRVPLPGRRRAEAGAFRHREEFPDGLAHARDVHDSSSPLTFVIANVSDYFRSRSSGGRSARLWSAATGNWGGCGGETTVVRINGNSAGASYFRSGLVVVRLWLVAGLAAARPSLTPRWKPVSRSRISAADRVGGAASGALGMVPGIRFAAGVRLGNPCGVEPAEEAGVVAAWAACQPASAARRPAGFARLGPAGSRQATACRTSATPSRRRWAACDYPRDVPRAASITSELAGSDLIGSRAPRCRAE